MFPGQRQLANPRDLAVPYKRATFCHVAAGTERSRSLASSSSTCSNSGAIRSSAHTKPEIQVTSASPFTTRPIDAI